MCWEFVCIWNLVDLFTSFRSSYDVEWSKSNKNSTSGGGGWGGVCLRIICKNAVISSLKFEYFILNSGQEYLYYIYIINYYIYAFFWPTFSDGLGWPKEKACHRTGVLIRCQKCKITQRQVTYFSPFFNFYISGVLALNRRVLVYPYFQILCRYRFF